MTAGMRRIARRTLQRRSAANRMQYFVRAMEKHRDSDRVYGPEMPCTGLDMAKAEAKRIVLAADPAIRLQADACTRNGGHVRTKYRCWVNDRGEFLESLLV
ncbi:MAG: hypothetical protein LAO79_28100 [Acidobacteriia bacterium]|nr:hypothetical protein [Terriglobia bacterium]